jgi:hypothetical protein
VLAWATADATGRCKESIELEDMRTVKEKRQGKTSRRDVEEKRVEGDVVPRRLSVT